MNFVRVRTELEQKAEYIHSTFAEYMLRHFELTAPLVFMWAPASHARKPHVNRIILRGNGVFTVEGDPKHRDILMKE